MTRLARPPAWLLIEGGGSRTWAATATRNAVTATAEAPSTNPRSVGEEQAVHTLVDLAVRLWDDADTGPVGVVAAHGAASTTEAAARFAKLVRRTLSVAGLPAAPVMVTNDIAPLLLTVDGPVCVAICGTGTGFAARNGPRWARASGLEWLLTDEGGGHDLAVAGLRAAVRALDGRGPATALTDAARRWCPTALSAPTLGEALFAHVYDVPDSKPLVASFARHVLEAAEGGDAVADRLVENTVDELVTGAAAVCRAAGITAQAAHTLVLSGSLLTEATTVRERFLARVDGQLHPSAVHQHTPEDRAGALLRLRDVWPQSDGVAALARALPTHADPPPLPAPGGGGRS